MANYKTEFTNVDLDYNKDSKCPYELCINLYEKKMVLIYNKKELKGLADFINKYLEDK
jgi:hypothetical protein